MIKHFLFKSLNIFIILLIFFSYNKLITHAHNMSENENEAVYAAIESALPELSSAGDSSSSGNASGNAVESSYFADGTYTGTGEGYGGDIVVDITIKDDVITDIEIVSADNEDASYFNMAKTLTSSIIEEQSTDIDTVSGATFSSTGILEAVNNALDQAVNR